MGLVTARLIVWPGASSPVGRSVKAYQTRSVPVSGRFAHSRSGIPKRKEIWRSVSPGAVVYVSGIPSASAVKLP